MSCFLRILYTAVVLRLANFSSAQKVILHSVECVAEILNRLDSATVERGIGLDVHAEVIIAVRGGAGGVEELVRVTAGSAGAQIRKALTVRAW